MVVFQIEYSDIGSVSYAELWAAEPFEAKPWYADYKLNAERKGDIWQIGCPYKLDVSVHTLGGLLLMGMVLGQ